MFDALDVARHLIRVGCDSAYPEESVFISPLRLQKLLYYCQGWSLGLLDRPLFQQPIEAWMRGPVVVEVYERFKETRGGLTPERAGEPTANLSATEAALVEMVWREYAGYTPGQLIEMTHTEPAWREARGTLAPTDPSSAPLSRETMATYFRSVAHKLTKQATPPGYPTLDPIATWKAEEEMERTEGTGTAAADVFEKLLAEVGE